MSRARRFFVAVPAAVAMAATVVVTTLITASSPSGAVLSTAAGFSPGGGFIYESDVDLARDLDDMAATGARWVRVDFPWSQVEATKGAFDWSRLDRVVTQATSRKLQVLALLAYTPAWARPAGTTMMTPPTNPADFANFARAAVQRYSATVKTWEVWNEPNISRFWAPAPDAAAYTTLLKAAYAAVHGADASATVITAGLSPAADGVGSQIAPATFLGRIYDNGGKGSFDAVGIHPYSYPARPMDPSTSSWNTFFRMPQLHDLMVTKGDGAKKVWSTEFGAPTGTAQYAVSEVEQAAIVKDAYAQIVLWDWAGPLLVYANRDSGTDLADREQNFGLRHRDFSPKPALATFVQSIGSVPVKTTSWPTRVTAVTGSFVSGSAASLSGDDNVYLQQKSSGWSTSSTNWYGSFFEVPRDAGQLTVTYVGSNSRSCSQAVKIYDWVNRTWVTLDSRSVGTGEVGLSGLAPPAAASQYVSGTSPTGEVRVAVTCRAASRFTANADRLLIDYTA